MACSNTSQQSESFIANALDLDIVIDKILEHLPIRVAAQTSVLSKQWRRNWLSLRSLVFDAEFSNKQSESESSKIISSILLYHVGPIDYFEVYDFYAETETYCVSPYIFYFSELVHLKLKLAVPSYDPTDFRGLRNLKHLELNTYFFDEENSFHSLVGNCSKLASLRLKCCYGIGIKHIVIDFPSLETLIITDVGCQSIAFKNVQSLEYISLYLRRQYGQYLETIELIDAENLANSSQLKSIEFDGCLCKSLVAGGILRSRPVTFNYLNKLHLYQLDLTVSGVFDNVLLLLESSPYIKMLDISFTQRKPAVQCKLEYNHNQELAHLREIRITRITRSIGQIKLIEYLLASSTVLEKLFFSAGPLYTESHLSKALMEFPRASTKARLVSLYQ